MPELVSLVRSFASRPYLGNPAGVCILSRPKPKPWMQSVAKEINFPETAFLHPFRDSYRIRWFTPTTEVGLCGHGTLAAAHILWEQERVPKNRTIRFASNGGPLSASRLNRWIELDFPAIAGTESVPPEGIAAALGALPRSFARTKREFIVEVDSERTVRGLKPSMEKIAALKTLGLLVTSLADSGKFDFVSRCFFPKEGIPEDPVTGSAHCALGPFWAKRLKKKNFLAYQASECGGVLRLRLLGDRVRLGGEARTTGRKEI